MTRLIPFLFIASLSSQWACQPQHPTPAEPAPELAASMGDLQRFAHKLGLSLHHANQPLAEFYLHEMEETLEEISEKIPTHDGLPIKNLLSTILLPPLAQLETSLKHGEFEQSLQVWPSVIQSCNRCHAATEHAFIRIQDIRENPFNQDFSPQNHAQASPSNTP
ncbi:MAG: hypothetical protein VX699_10965 [Myxococcota bacterium]|nr:hypothetical protein [Myxococcota bacterium]